MYSRVKNWVVQQEKSLFILSIDNAQADRSIISKLSGMNRTNSKHKL